jgi:hypothetical protein
MRSFCGGFSSTFCLADSRAFVILACWPIAAGLSCFLFAGRSYLCVPRSRRQRLPQPRLCGSVLSVAARCASLSGSRRTSFANAKTPRLDALTAPSSGSLTSRNAPLPRREATSVSISQNHPLRRPSCWVRMDDSCSQPRLQRHSCARQIQSCQSRYQRIGIQTP